MANAVQNALKRKRELQQELAEIDRFLALYDQFSGTRVASKSSEAAPAKQESSRDSRADVSGPTGEKRMGRPSEFADYMERIIEGVQRPMSRSELVEHLEAQGIEVPSSDKPRYLGTILWRHRDRFVNIAGKGYTLARLLSPEGAAEERELSELLGEDGDVAELE
jgi:hypothetical protein